MVERRELWGEILKAALRKAYAVLNFFKCAAGPLPLDLYGRGAARKRCCGAE